MRGLGARDRFHARAAETAAQFAEIGRGDTLALEKNGQRYFAPTNLEEFAAAFEQYPDAVLLGGGTDVGLWVTKLHRRLDTLIYTARCRRTEPAHGRRRVHRNRRRRRPYRRVCRAGRRIIPISARCCGASPRSRCATPARLAAMSATPRRSATRRRCCLALGAHTGPAPRRRRSANCRSMNSSSPIARRRCSRASSSKRSACRGRSRVCNSGAYKISKRFDQDISAVCAAFALRVEGGRVAHIRLGFGGMAAMPKRASHAEAALLGQVWNEATARAGDARARATISSRSPICAPVPPID